MTSEFLHHEACDSCGSSDGRAVFSDGHKWCFVCEKFTFPTGGVELLSITDSLIDSLPHRGNNNKKNDRVFTLPDDYTHTIPSEGLDWLLKYEIEFHEILKKRIGWSQTGVMVKGKMIGPLLVMPFFDANGVLHGWQGRNFSKTEPKPKYITHKAPDRFQMYYCIGAGTKSLVFVEDIISAMKVSRVVDCTPLLGNRISKPKLALFAQGWNTGVFWLDPDMQTKQLNLHRIAEMLFPNGAFMVSTLHDPKAYSTEEIRKTVDFS